MCVREREMRRKGKIVIERGKERVRDRKKEGRKKEERRKKEGRKKEGRRESLYCMQLKRKCELPWFFYDDRDI